MTASRRVRKVTGLSICGLVLAATPALAGVATAAPATRPAPDARETAASGERPTVDADDLIRQELWVRVDADTDRDGRKDKVHIQVTRPRSTKKLATIFQISPYAAGGNNDVKNHNVDHELWYPGKPSAADSDTERFLARGYASVFAYSLGSGMSTGCPTVGDAGETAGPKAVIDWLNGRAVAKNAKGKLVKARWATGKVGMIGTSYDGTLPNAVAATGVEGLEAIIPVSAISSWYDYYRANGLVVAPDQYQGEDVDVLAKFVYTRKNREICKPVMRRLARQQDRKSGDYSKFWRKRDFVRHAEDVEAAVLVAHGLQDWNVKPGAASRWYEALRANQVDHMIYWHQGGHGGEPPRDVINKWFDHYLYGVDNGIDKAPRSLIRQPDDSILREKEWPAPAARNRTFRLAARGADAFGDLTNAAGSGTEAFTDDASYDVKSLVNDQATDHGLIYASEELAGDSRLSGTPAVDLNLAFGAKAANVSVAVVDVKPDGTVSRVVTRGWADPQNADSLTDSKALVPGRRYQLGFDLEPGDYTFAAGHRIGFVVMSSEHDYTIRPKPGTKVTLNLAKSSVTLPLLPTKN